MPLTQDRPKCMVEVAGRAIVDTIVDELGDMGVEELVVVTGHQAEALRAHLQTRAGFRWHFVHNQRYETTNNILSLHVAAHLVRPPFALVESDIYLHAPILRGLARPDTMLVAPYMPTMDGTGIVMDADKRVREMVIRAHLHRPAQLHEMHKTVNFYSFSSATWQRYRAALERWVQAERLDQYYEAVLAELINDGQLDMQAVDVGLQGWAEVDDLADLARLEEQLKTS